MLLFERSGALSFPKASAMLTFSPNTEAICQIPFLISNQACSLELQPHAVGCWFSAKGDFAPQGIFAKMETFLFTLNWVKDAIH